MFESLKFYCLSLDLPISAQSVKRLVRKLGFQHKKCVRVAQCNNTLGIQGGNNMFLTRVQRDRR